MISDRRFTKTNEMFKAIKVRSKTAGKGVRRYIIPIDDVYMIKLNNYFKDMN